MIDKELLQNYYVELRRGSLTLSVLGCLKVPHYGYALLETMQNKGVDIEANTLYPLLRRLESQDILTSDWDTSESRPRKYYTLSDTGKEVYQELLKEWYAMQECIDNICGEDKK